MSAAWMRRIHHWLGLIIGLQLLLWMSSGVVMSVLDAERARGRDTRVPRQAQPPWPHDVLSPNEVLARAGTAVHGLTTAWLLDLPVYRLAAGKSTRLVDARSGQTVELTPALAQRLAVATYKGPGQPGMAQLVEPSLETRSHDGPVWRVPFSDAEDTTVYLSRQGDLLAHRNNTWRLFDFFWMLHIMDYSGRKDFNNALVVGSAVGGLWLALSGTWLLFTSFRLAEFVPRRWRAQRQLVVLTPDGQRLRGVAAASGDTVFVALARHGLPLPSNCGGGQSCGLCAVRVRGVAPPATAADRLQLSRTKLDAGYRLACNLPVSTDLQLEVGGGAESWTTHTATVEQVRAVSPLLRELVLKPGFKPGPAYRPGSYVQLHVPPYVMSPAQLQVPDEHVADWGRLALPAKWHNKAALRRSYSLSTPVDLSDGRLSLLVRFLTPDAGGGRHAPGRGSAYLYGLQVGDEVAFNGPFGDFALQPGGREKIFIGGGAGMGPLRAMILELLQRGAREPLHFWYGARTLRESPYQDEMTRLAAQHANFRWQLVLSDDPEAPAGDAPPLTGRVHEAVEARLLRQHTHLAACDFYVCGPPAMLAATLACLRSLGVKDERISFDDFKL
ncbi:MAG: hypothetical protein C0505_16365 [Leptothrix sp. (in: Bacteria)]|nr:hypothetical protein [Leptothrix sp. (in: b-proteobacteria)]